MLGASGFLGPGQCWVRSGGSAGVVPSKVDFAPCASGPPVADVT